MHSGIATFKAPAGHRGLAPDAPSKLRTLAENPESDESPEETGCFRLHELLPELLPRRLDHRGKARPSLLRARQLLEREMPSLDGVPEADSIECRGTLREQGAKPDRSADSSAHSEVRWSVKFRRKPPRRSGILPNPCPFLASCTTYPLTGGVGIISS
jgi:hypothetical protein